MIEILFCLVVAVTDGDTIRVRCMDSGQIRVRLVGIDAPERGQAFGSRSRQALNSLCYRKRAEIRSTGYDKFGRMLGYVRCAGKDANASQVRSGMAWVDRYATDRNLHRLQWEARRARRGLWADKKAIAPWEWRKRRTS